MARAVVHLPAPLRLFTGGAGEVEVEGDTVLDALRALETRHPDIARRIVDGDGRLRPFVSLFADDVDVRARGGLMAPLGEGAVIFVVQAVAGG